MRAIDADELKGLFPDSGEGAWTYNVTAKLYIDAQPTIEPERKTGRWELGTDLDREWCICSECFHQQWDKTNYCPNCGADMTEESEEPKRCDTCKHEKEPWSMQCHRCEDYNLWEGKR